MVSAGLFALAHGSIHPWVLVDLGLFATTATVLTWRTGGMEAAVVMHTLHNTTVLLGALLTGGFADSFVSADTTGSPTDALLWGLEDAAVLAVVFRHAHRHPPQRLLSPTPPRSPG